jgi:Rrf2 family cysteine metabolism transcriptional repressor
MKISTKVRYGTRAMVTLAMANSATAISVKEIARHQHLSAKYLEQIMAALKGAGLIKVVRGGQGGYMLSREAENIRVMEVYQALEGSLSLVDCIEDPNACPMRETCPTKDTWEEMTGALEEILERTTIQDLVKRQREKGNSADSMYHI